MESLRDELIYRLQEDLDYFNQAMPRENAIAWRGYFAGLLEWDVIDVQTHDILWSMLPEIDDDPVMVILLGREESEVDQTT